MMENFEIGHARGSAKGWLDLWWLGWGSDSVMEGPAVV